MTREAVCKVCKRGFERGRHSRRHECGACAKVRYRFRERLRVHQGKPRAHGAVRRAIEKGLLPPLDGRVRCVDCGRDAEVYDHRDYAYPLFVEPVCMRCNSRRGAGRSAPATEPKKRPTGQCLQCGVSIAHRHPASLYCFPCTDIRAKRSASERRGVSAA